MDMHSAHPFNKLDVTLETQRTGAVMGDRYMISPPHWLLVPFLARAVLTLKQYTQLSPHTNLYNRTYPSSLLGYIQNKATQQPPYTSFFDYTDHIYNLTLSFSH